MNNRISVKSLLKGKDSIFNPSQPNKKNREALTHGIASIQSDNVKDVVEHAWIRRKSDMVLNKKINSRSPNILFNAPKVKDYSKLFQVKSQTRTSSRLFSG
jgi:hypothetical protein